MTGQIDDNMDQYYRSNPSHYDTGLMRIGCTETQARAYAAYFRRNLRWYYYRKIICVYELLLSRFNRRIRILDVGCGLGEDIHALNRLIPSADFVGVEISPSAVEICKKNKLDNMEFLCGTLSTLNLSQETFDLILSFTVLEHVASPREELENYFKLLKKDGILVLAVPNDRYWWSWEGPNYVLLKLLGKPVHTHSVKKRVLYDIFDKLGLFVLDYDVVGFRPPQSFFCHIPENLLGSVISHFEKIGQAWQRTFLRSLLYLEIYICLKRPLDEQNFSGLAYSNSNPSPLWIVSALPYFVIWWNASAVALVRRVFKKLQGYIYGQRSKN